MKVILENKQPTTISLGSVPVGACVRPSSLELTTPIVYMRIEDPLDFRYELVRLNDGELFTIEHLDGGLWELADTKLVVSG